MEIASGLVLITLVVLGVTTVARRLSFQAPLLLVGLGILAGYLPFIPNIRLAPELVLVGILPPLLYAAALRTSLVDVRAERSPIALLAVGATLFTTAAVAITAWWLVPQPFSWAAAFALGAVVAPPDAVAATTVARRVGMPRRIVAILEGESLINDATALVALSSAIAALGGSLLWWQVGFKFIFAAGGAVVIGLIIAWIGSRMRQKIQEPVVNTAFSLVLPFISYLIAEELHMSGVLAVVVTGMVLGHTSHVQQSGAARLAEASNWRTIQYLLENGVFLLIGLQMPYVVQQARADVADRELVIVCLGILGVVLVSRVIWVQTTYRMRWVYDRYLRPGSLAASGWSVPGSLVISWAGMRGVVSMAAAFALPQDFPHRGLGLLVAMVVVVGTLTLQGLSLPHLARRLGLPAPDPMADAQAQAELLAEIGQAGQAALRAAIRPGDPEQVQERLIQQSQLRTERAWDRLSHPSDSPTAATVQLRLRLEMLSAERQALVRARDAGRYDDEVLHAVSSLLDGEEALLDRNALPIEQRLRQDPR